MNVTEPQRGIGSASAGTSKKYFIGFGSYSLKTKYQVKTPVDQSAPTSDDFRLLEMPACLTLWDWSYLRVPPQDHLMGQVFSTSSRSLLVGLSGIGKTNFLMALALSISQGRDFIHWQSGRPARVLYIDGEMGLNLAKARISDAQRRLGQISEPNHFNFFCLNSISERPPPLNCPEGQQYIDNVIERVTPEFIVFDNIQSLLSGQLTDEAPWASTLNWTYELTRKRIGQLWVHHTIRDGTRGYGSSVKQWSMDNVILAEGVRENSTRVLFRLSFQKARQRTPDNLDDFGSKIIGLDDDRWSVLADSKERKSRVGATKSVKSPAPAARKFYDALLDALAHAGECRERSADLPSVTMSEWEVELHRLGLIRSGDERDAKRSRSTLIARYRQELIVAEWIACNEDLLWSIKLLT